MDIMEPTQRFSRTVPCPNCKEDYSITYKRCPFCGGPPKKVPKQVEPEPVYPPSEEIFRSMLQEDAPEGRAAEAPPSFPQGVHPEARPVPTTAPAEAPPPAEATAPSETPPQPPIETVVLSVAREKSAPEPAPAPAPPESPKAPPQETPAAPVRATGRQDTDSRPSASPSAAPAPARTPVAVLPREIDIELPELDFADIDTIEESPPARGGKRLESRGRGAARSSGRSERKSGGGAGRVIGVLFSLLIVAAAIYIVATRATPYIQTFLAQREQGVIQGEDPAPPEEPQEAVFRLEETEATLTAKDAIQTLIPVFEGTEADPERGELTWKSSDPAVVTVSSEGKLTAVGVGSAVVSVTRANGDLASCQVTCQWEEGAIVLGNLYLNTDDFTLRPGESFTMKLIGTDAPVTWSIDKPHVATISETGVVKYVSKGNAIITCTVGPYAVTGVVRCP